MSTPIKSALVSTAWLAEAQQKGSVKIIDASWYLPTEKRDPKAEYRERHIPGAQYFDIDEIADTTSDLPHMFPSARQFADAVGAMGIGNDDNVVCYDGGAMTASCRAWWMFRTFGHQSVAVLDGGFRKWCAEGRAVDAAIPSPTAATYHAELNKESVRSLSDIQQIVAGKSAANAQILDARSLARFLAQAPEPRPGMRAGHMPGAHNLPYTDLLTEEGTLKSADAVQAALQQRSNLLLNKDQEIVTSCGSGVSAAVLLLALAESGYRNIALYDGSWSEWGGRSDTAIVVE